MAKHDPSQNPTDTERRGLLPGVLNRRSRRHDQRRVHTAAVLGLGRFGTSLALELEAQGIEVLGIDNSEDTVQDLSGPLSYAVRADIARADALAQLSVTECDHVVVAVGGRIETSVLACSHLLRAGVTNLWAKADSEAHAMILEQMGVRHVITPQKTMGRRVAHLLADSAEDWVEYGGGFAMGRFVVPPELIGHTTSTAGIERDTHARIMAHRNHGGQWQYTDADTVFEEGAELIVAGTTKALEVFGRHC